MLGVATFIVIVKLGMRNNVQFKRLLDTLARSSAQAVTTLGQRQKEQEELKKHLYIKTARNWMLDYL